MKQPRISFNQHDMGHLYEMAIEHMCPIKDNCALCSSLTVKIEKYLGKKDVAFIKKLIRKNGHCNKLLAEQEMLNRVVGEIPEEYISIGIPNEDWAEGFNFMRKKVLFLLSSPLSHHQRHITKTDISSQICHKK